MSPWNKDRPPVHPRSTCELNVECFELLHLFLVASLGQQILIIIEDLFSSVTKGWLGTI